jgi:ubiquinone/menaquinone biosynthesis C-methylase UbiE
MGWLDKYDWGRKLSRATRLFFFKHDALRSAKLRGDAKTVDRLYDIFAPVYDFVFPRVESYGQTVDHIVDNLVEPGDRILDLGAGTGILTVRMAPKAAGVVAMDLNRAMLERARKKSVKKAVASKVTYNQGNACQLPFKDGSFTLVTSAFMEVYLEIEQKTAMLREIHRVLAPGGRVIFMTGNGEVSGRYIKRWQWEEIFRNTSYTGVEFTDLYDVFRVIWARRAERPLLPA